MIVTPKQHSLRTEELDYALPEHLIATQPMEPRDAARMMVVRRSSDLIEHRHIRDFPEYLHEGDALVFNNTKVVPARLIGKRTDTSGGVEGLFLEETSSSPPQWRVMLKAGGRLKPGVQIELHNAQGQPTGYIIELREQVQSEWIVELHADRPSQAVLATAGWTPLPPYILRARGDTHFDDREDRRWYQTVFANEHQNQSVAAPTAGLHFTPALLETISSRGIDRIEVTLHVGAGTFKPVTAETLDQHRMHTESFEVSRQAIAQLKTLVTHRSQSVASGAAAHGARLFAVGTTSTRTLESLPRDWMQLCGPIAGMTDLMITPPYEFKLVDGLLTNFHLPRSTLLALVGAMLGLDRVKAAYQLAIEHDYRFYSYGDAMLILP